jgi:hypothetical protein
MPLFYISLPTKLILTYPVIFAYQLYLEKDLEKYEEKPAAMFLEK